MTSDVHTELIGILKNLSLKVDARLKGWEYVLGLTATEDGLNHILNKYIPFIISYSEDEKELTNLVYKCLINISNQEKGATALVTYKKDFIQHLLHNICEEEQSFVQAKCYILSNLSAHSVLSEQITDVLVSSKDLLQKLMKAYCSANSDVRKQFDFLTLVFANVSRWISGRRFFLQDANFMKSILSFTNPIQPQVRRLGVALILRNCCLETDQHERLLKDLNILPAILLPLMDSREYKEDEMEILPLECQWLEESKERDKDPSVRRILVQVLTALCYSAKGWDYLWSKGVYYVIRELHLWETDEAVKGDIENLVTYYLAEEYSQPQEGEDFASGDPNLIQQLESDIVRDLPDFVI